MLDTEFIGSGSFEDLQAMKELANNFAYKGSSKWRLPKWEELKQMHPHDWESQSGELWTDNSSSSRYTAKKMNLSTGDFTECNQKFQYEEPALCRLMCDENFTDVRHEIISVDDCKFFVMPFAEMNYGAVDELNTLFSKMEFRGFTNFRRPTIEELKLLLPHGRELRVINSGWYWSSSEGGKFNAFKVNFHSQEIYACKKSSDYFESKAFSIVIVE
jgi:hypothetical protein